MTSLLDNPCGLASVGMVAFAIGSAAIARREPHRQLGSAIGGVVVIICIFIGLFRHHEALTVLAQAVGTGLLAVGVSWVALTLIALVWDGIKALLPEPVLEPAPEPELPRQEPPPVPTPPPSPTRAENADAAKAEYKKSLDLLDAADISDDERNAAKEEAKNKYLRDLDGLIK